MTRLERSLREEFLLNTLIGQLRETLREEGITLTEEQVAAVQDWLNAFTEHSEKCPGCYEVLQFGARMRIGRRREELVILHARCEQRARHHGVKFVFDLIGFWRNASLQSELQEIMEKRERQREEEIKRRRNGHAKNGNGRKSEPTSRISPRVHHVH